MKAQRSVRKEIGLERKRRMKSALDRRALRHTQKEVGLENALPEESRALRRTQKDDRVRKHTTQEVRARRRTKKEVGLENALPKMVEGSKAHSNGGMIWPKGALEKAKR
ncbi:hypothetical protein Peur_030676 [Populus x canadensis]